MKLSDENDREWQWTNYAFDEGRLAAHYNIKLDDNPFDLTSVSSEYPMDEEKLTYLHNEWRAGHILQTAIDEAKKYAEPTD